MTTLAHEARHTALIERLLEMLRHALEMMSPPPAEEDDIDWEDGEPEDETTRAA